MKALYYLTAITLLTLGSCSSGLYVAREYDDLYFVASDQPVATTILADRRPQVGTLKSEEYYDNIYAADTLVSSDYTDALSYNDANINYYSGSGGGIYDYYDGYYSSRINRFYGNYFNPYWRDPFYYGYGYSPFSLSFGYGFGSPYLNPYYGYYDPFFYDSYYYGYGSMYGGYYGSYYSPYYNPWYSRYYSPYYYGYTDAKYTVPYGRTERASNLSTRWTGGTSAPSASDRRDPYLSTDRARSGGTQAVSSDARRTVTDKSIIQDPTKSGTQSISASPDRRAVTTKPEYNSVERTYTPSYNNPRMSTRPSYNNSRVDQNTTPAVNTGRTNTNQSQAPGVRSTVPSISAGQIRSGTSAPTYSVPARRSTDIGSSSRSYNSSGSGFSSGSGSMGGSSSSSGGSSSSSRSSSSSSSSSGSSSRR
jgi:hypothetical protein